MNGPSHTSNQCVVEVGLVNGPSHTSNQCVVEVGLVYGPSHTSNQCVVEVGLVYGPSHTSNQCVVEVGLVYGPSHTSNQCVVEVPMGRRHALAVSQPGDECNAERLREVRTVGRTAPIVHCAQWTLRVLSRPSNSCYVDTMDPITLERMLRSYDDCIMLLALLLLTIC